MSLAAKSRPNQVDLPPSSPPSRASLSPLTRLESIVESLHVLSRSWKAMNADEDSLNWRTRLKRATGSLETLRALSEHSPT